MEATVTTPAAQSPTNQSQRLVIAFLVPGLPSMVSGPALHFAAEHPVGIGDTGEDRRDQH